MDFPSGPWTGFYNYGRSTRKHRMDLALSFADHAVTGDGNDDIGRFFVTGRFDGTNGECYWTKTYIGAHDVYYRGFREGKGIWGLWELPNESGGFHIWPVGEQESEHGQESAEESPHIEAIPTFVKHSDVWLQRCRLDEGEFSRRIELVLARLNGIYATVVKANHSIV